MDGQAGRQIHTISTTWDHDDAQWVVEFDMANVGGLIRCVGVKLRSYGLAPQTVDLDAGQEPQVPRPVTSNLLRKEFTFDRLLKEALQAEALTLSGMGADWASVADEIKERTTYDVSGLMLKGPEPPPREVFESVERAIRDVGLPEHYDDLAGDHRRAARAPGRPREHTREECVRVAQEYLKAVNERGSSSPTKDVSQKLHISYDVAAKLVWRCRHKEGLLPPPGWDGPWPVGRRHAERENDDE